VHYGVVRRRFDGRRHAGVSLHRIRVVDLHDSPDHWSRRQWPKLDWTDTGLCQLQDDESFRLGGFGE
jgi:hypothetical protein